ncbi:short chain dehydrogenase/reductase SDR [Penicillium hispanicum]|uniref:short chain dehydrogenase/reductase SDR n=1 Tax=Penicillium hispanicum TaxID=1080232 RepID=UPI002541D5FD|nr:short chain dehydrogenase/reductase SDR [Penicillium hispanicum]KAJ5570231.1 short chain dehydrogenase/reductase SDR [Penicillium hispanicum]
MNGTVVITGANGSLALGFVESFLQLYPHHTLIATVRNPSVSHDPNTAKLKELVAKYPSHVSIETLDLGKLSSVRSFADSISRRVSSAELPRISAVICNAATLSLEAGQKFTPDGYEATFQVCHLSHFLLILKLVGSLDTTSGRIVMLGSVTHYPEKPNPLSSLKPEIPDNWEHLVKPGPDPQGLVHDRGFQRYGTAKLANVILANDLNRRFQADPKLSKITALAMDPGGLPSSRAQAEQKKSTRRLFAVMNFLMPLLKHLTTAFRTTEDAGRDLVAVSLDPKFQGEGGYYVCQKQASPTAISTDVEVQRGLWDSCCKWAGLSNEETML